MADLHLAPNKDYYDEQNSDNVCYLCHSPRYEVLHQVTTYGFPFRFQRCQCGLIKQTPMPNGKFFEWFFNSEIFYSAKETNQKRIWGFYDYFKDEDCRMATSQRRYRVLSKYFHGDSPKRIMKIGPSTGTFLHVAKQHGHNVLGCDVSTKFVKYAEDHYGVHIDVGRYEHQPYQDNSFDVVLLFNVIENIPNLFEFMTAVKRTISIGGRLILNHVEMKGNIIEKLQGQKYFMYRPPICYMFDSAVLKRILEMYGFEIEETLLDIRYMHMEKILTLLHWNKLLAPLKSLRMHNRIFPAYAYPSRITIARRVR